jgi:hypothetical protein
MFAVKVIMAIVAGIGFNAYQSAGSSEKIASSIVQHMPTQQQVNQQASRLVHGTGALVANSSHVAKKTVSAHPRAAMVIRDIGEDS